ncbi:MAG: hypothetical protein V1827_01635, partial [Candidatus Micrarchaeota archaeon]
LGGEKFSPLEYPYYVPISGLKKKPYLSAIEAWFAVLGKAADSGDMNAYLKAERGLLDRINMSASRLQRSGVFQTWITKVQGADLASIKGIFGLGAPIKGQKAIPAPAGLKSQIQSFERERAALIGELNSKMREEGELPAKECMDLLARYATLARRVSLYSHIYDQLEMGRRYRDMLKSGTGTQMAMADAALARSNKELEKALSLVPNTNFKDQDSTLTLFRHFTEATSWRRQALVVYSAEASGFFGAVDSAKLRRRYTKGYEDLQDRIFTELLAGNPDSAGMGALRRLKQAVWLVENSVFAMPSMHLSQQFRTLDGYQARILDNAWRVAYSANSTAGADRLLKESEATFEAMKKVAKSNAFWGNVATALLATALFFTPAAPLGLAIFASIPADAALREYAARGALSNKTKLVLAITAVTLVFGGAGAIVGTQARFVSAGGFNSARNWAIASVTLDVANIVGAVGLGGYALYEAHGEYKKGDYKEAVFLGAMALFPLLHMGVSAGLRVRARRAEAREDAAMLADLLKRTEGPALAFEGALTPAQQRLRTPSGLYDFLRVYANGDRKTRKQMLGELPEGMRKPIESLAADKDVLASLKGGAMPLEIAAILRRTIIGFEGPKPTGSGPSGRRIETEASSWLQGSTGMASFREFVAGLLTPANATGASRSARKAAKAKLAELREANPEAAKIIDGLLKIKAVRRAAKNGDWGDKATGEMELALQGKPGFTLGVVGGPTTRTTPGTRGLKDVLPKDAQAAEARATMQMEYEVLNVSGGEPIIIERAVPVPGTGRPMPTRASAGEGGAPVVPAPQVGVVTPREGGGAAPAPAPAPTVAPGQQPAKGPGLLRRMGRGIAGEAREAWGVEKKAEAAKMNPNDGAAFRDLAGSSMNRLIDDACLPQVARARIDARAREGKPLGREEARALEESSGRLSTLVKLVYERAKSPEGAAKQTRNDNKAFADDTLLTIFSRRNSRSALEELARNDPELREVIGYVHKTARSRGKSLDEVWRDYSYLDLADRAPMLLEMMERGTGARLTRAFADIRSLGMERDKLVEDLAAISNESKRAKITQRISELTRRIDALEERIRIAVNGNEPRPGAQGYAADPAYGPLRVTEYILGQRLTNAQRAAYAKSLEQTGVIPGQMIRQMRDHVESYYSRRGPPCIENVEAAGMAGVSKTFIAKALSAKEWGVHGSMDDIVLASIRSKEMGSAFRGRTETNFADANRSGLVDAAVQRFKNALKADTPEKIVENLNNLAKDDITGLFKGVAEDWSRFSRDNRGKRPADEMIGEFRQRAEKAFEGSNRERLVKSVVSKFEEALKADTPDKIVENLNNLAAKDQTGLFKAVADELSGLVTGVKNNKKLQDSFGRRNILEDAAKSVRAEPEMPGGLFGMGGRFGLGGWFGAVFGRGMGVGVPESSAYGRYRVYSGYTGRKGREILRTTPISDKWGRAK